jgi:hypothetical protein
MFVVEANSLYIVFSNMHAYALKAGRQRLTLQLLQ